ncbi:universal stress protein [Algoriphagus boritolerans]|uniref:universal stress protein n=1 Tax=Algoriphagus boritolerans TaxID=308111 RepID=UPI002FCDE419
MIKDGEKLLIKLIEKYEASGVKMDYKITDGVPSISIVRIADELGVSLIVMGTQGASGIKKSAHRNHDSQLDTRGQLSCIGSTSTGKSDRNQ